MTELDNDQLVFRFPDVHPDAAGRISFQRTLRIPDDGRDYPLPPGLGCFPLRHVDDARQRARRDVVDEACYAFSDPQAAQAPRQEMGLAPGGRMRQEVCEDSHGLDAWDQSSRSRCFAHVLNSVQYFHVTGSAPPHRPPTAAQYAEAGMSLAGLTTSMSASVR